MLSSSPMGQRGTAPEATSVLLFAVVAALLWFALGRNAPEARASEPRPVSTSALEADDLRQVSDAQH